MITAAVKIWMSVSLSSRETIVKQHWVIYYFTKDEYRVIERDEDDRKMPLIPTKKLPNALANNFPRETLV